MARIQPGVGPDAWRGLLAVEQNLAGRSSSLSDIVVADRGDLTRDHAEESLWWPPGQQTFIYLLRRGGLSIGTALRVVVLGTTLVGAIAWSVYFFLVLGRRPLTLALIALLVWYRAAHANAFIYYGGETWMWALAPVAGVLFLITWRASGPRAWTWAFVAGVTCGLLIFVKYAGLIVDAGFLVAGLLIARRSRGGWATIGAWTAGLVLTTAVWFVASGAPWPSMTPASPRLAPRVPGILAWNTAGPLMSLADVYDAASLVRRKLRIDMAVFEAIVPLSIGVLAIFAAWWISRPMGTRPESARPPSAGHARTLAISVAVTTSLVLAVLMLRGGVISFEGRHQQYGAYLLLPFLADAIVRSLRGTVWTSWRGIAALACGGVFIVGPAVYGAAILVHESLRFFPRVAAGVGPTGVRFDWTGHATARAFIDEINSLPGAESALLVSTSPDIALTFPNRRVLFVLDRGDAEHERFPGHPDAGVLLVAPSTVDDTDIEIAKASFVDIHAWTRIRLSSIPTAHVWRGQ